MLATAVFPAEVRATDHHPVKPGLGQNIFEPPVPLANVELVQFDGGEGQMEGDHRRHDQLPGRARLRKFGNGHFLRGGLGLLERSRALGAG